MLKRTYYEILELARNAPTAEIKSNYRRLAKRYHPDLNPNNPGAAQHFLEIQKAYEVLSDAEKRHQYDLQFPDAPFFPPKENNYRWGNRGSRAYRRYDGRQRQKPYNNISFSKPTQPRTAYLHYIIEVSLPELFKGTERTLTVGQTFTCRRCRGRGKLDTGVKCERCDGFGFLVHFRPFIVTMPPGLLPDMQIRLDVTDGQPEHPILDAPVITDIAATIRLKVSPPYHYQDKQLYASVQVPASLLIAGGQWTIPAPEGGQLTFKIPAATDSGSVLTLRRHGLRNGSSPRRGNLLCTVVAMV